MTDMTENFICSKCNKIIKNGQICFYVKRKIFCSKCYIQDVKENEQLKQQLEEKDKEIAHLKEKDNYHLRYELAGADETIANLRQQLAEKQNTIDEINKEFVQSIHDWKTLCAEKDNEIERLNTKQKPIVMHSKENYYFLEEENIKLHFAQKQLAITELEKVKKRLLEESKRYPIVYDITNDLVGGAIDKNKVFETLDQQIKELKGE